jgi:hypothetical protein
MHAVEVVALFALIAASFVFGSIYGRYLATKAKIAERKIDTPNFTLVYVDRRIAELEQKFEAKLAEAKKAL